MPPKKRNRETHAAPKPGFDPLAGRRWLGWLCLATLLVHFTPLFSSQTSIQWDAADVHYSVQKYFAQELKQGRLAVWTPYLFSGFPFLADPQVGAFYPLNWPFFLIGITPAAIQAELALHTLIALIGAFLLFERMLSHRAAALLGALAYGLSGFFAGHSSHVGMFQAAALLPWALLFFDRGLGGGGLANAAMCGLTCGLAILAGHLQTALYLVAALGLFAAARILETPTAWRGALAGTAVALALALALSAVVTLPALELTPLSIRGGVNYGSAKEGVLTLGALGTLILPDWYGVLSGRYAGPADRTQYYFYAGILLLPLAAAGLRDKRVRTAALVIAVPAAWYMLGPSFGLYRLGAILPGFHNVRAPVNGWFTVALPLALLAGAGAVSLGQRWNRSWLPLVLAAVFLFDLAHFNSWTNPLAYARNSWRDLYGAGIELLGNRVSPRLAPGARLHMAANTAAFGPMNSPLDARVEATYGYNPLALKSYAQFMDATLQNPRLLSVLSVGVIVDAAQQGLVEVRDSLPQASFAPRVRRISGLEESARLLSQHNPAEEALAEAMPDGLAPDPEAEARLAASDHRSLRFEYRTRTRNLLRIGVPWYPGWSARCSGNPCGIYRVDHALMGVVVPPGNGTVELRFESRRLAAGAGISLAGLAVALFALIPRRARGNALELGSNLW